MNQDQVVAMKMTSQSRILCPHAIAWCVTRWRSKQELVAELEEVMLVANEESSLERHKLKIKSIRQKIKIIEYDEKIRKDFCEDLHAELNECRKRKPTVE